MSHLQRQTAHVIDTGTLTGRPALQEMTECGLFLDGHGHDVLVPDALHRNGVAIAPAHAPLSGTGVSR
ncbi:hypothetical protein [Frankia sp. CiP3]|uniref:hypothetical protein n=1 Tax=Frankia sp. CiP3 TaxID=2880971 RepID=UPI001EF41ABA|nr:hypothetical protein [Frankia sp. CiP3]